MKYTLFIHTNHRQTVPTKVGEYSFRKMTRNADKFDIRILWVYDFPALSNWHGQLYLREGKRVPWNMNDPLSFAPLRFLPPQLMNYEGRAIVVDPDVFALADIYELFNRDMGGKAILCRRVESSAKPSFYTSSVMLLDCCRLRYWNWEKNLDEMFSFKRDLWLWMCLKLEPPESVGTFEAEWNDLDTLTDRTRILHNTCRMTQPWKTGLVLDFMPEALERRLSKKWGIIPRSWIHRVRSLIEQKPYFPLGIFRPHPDSKQERLFFTLLAKAVELGIITRDEITAEIENGNVRPDAISLLDQIFAKGFILR